MADDLTLPATSSVVATDDVSGVHYQKVKLFDSTDGSSTPVGTTANPLKVAEIESDCTSVLSTTISAAGVTSGIDTTGYGALVWQISGVWQGNCFFEASNDNSVWDTILVFSRDNLSLQDIITSGGLYTIRPSGKYVRLNVTAITGSMTVVAIGREAEGIAAADLLSLAMDRQNNTPLQVQLQGHPVDPAGAMLPASDKYITLPFLGAFTNRNLLTEDGSWLDTDGYQTAYITLAGNSASGSFTIEATNVPGFGGSGGTIANSFGATGLLVSNGTGLTNGTQIQNFGSTNTPPANITYVVPCLARYIRYKMVSAGVNQGWLHVRLSRAAVSLTTSNISVSNTAAANMPVTTTPGTPNALSVNSAATTNATSVKASAGSVTSLVVSNAGAAAAFLKLYNKASAPTVGTDVPVLTVPIGASGIVNVDCGSLGLRFSTGIALAITNLIADSDTTAVAANQVKVFGSYI